MIAIRGIGSRIAIELIEMLDRNEDVLEIERESPIPLIGVERYLFCQGVLYGKCQDDTTIDEMTVTYKVNYIDIAESCNNIIVHNPIARICVIGSESGISGSFDKNYAGAKSLLHDYVETKILENKNQQLVCVAPWIIEDAGMTLRRTDHANLEKLRNQQTKKRFAFSKEVARLVKFLLYEDDGYITGTVIRMHGGRVP